MVGAYKEREEREREREREREERRDKRVVNPIMKLVLCLHELSALHVQGGTSPSHTHPLGCLACFSLKILGIA